TQTSTPPELQLMAAAQHALREDPRRALTLAEQHAREYPHGRFVEEREEIAISALMALHQRADGAERARVFLARYPTSLLRLRIEALLASGK
ncbi:MAG: hypothetical protein ABW321_03940, partial [Polyangiales bacterium]